MICLFMKVYIRKGIYIARNLSPNLQLKTHRKKNSCCKCHHQPPHHQSHVCFSSIRSSPNLGSWRLKCWKIETWEVRGFDRFAICQIYKSNQPQKIKRFKKRHQLPNEQLVSSFGNLDFLSTRLLSSAKLTASLGSPTARLGGAQAWRSSDKKMEEIGFLEENVFFFKNLPLFFLEILPWPDQPRLSRQALHGMLYPSFPQRSCLFKTRGTSWKLVKLYYAILFMKKDIQIRSTLENTSPIAFWGDTWPLSRKMSSYLASIVNYKISTFKADHTPRKQLVCHHARYNFFWDFPTPSVGLPGPIANFAAVVPSVEHQPVQKGSSKHHLAKTLFSPFLLKSSFDLLLSTLSQQNSLSQVGNSWPKTHRISWDAIQLISSISPRQLTRRLNSCMAVSLRCAASVKILRWSRAAGVPFGACNTTRSESAKPNAFLSFWSLCLVVPLRIPPAPLPQA